MRVLLKVNMPVEEGNDKAREGTLGKTISEILSDLKPEAVYFTDDQGMRSGYLFLNINDASEIPRICEPWFLAFNADVELHPVMVPADLEKASTHIQSAVEKYG